jgi:hypothetical protein
MTTYSKNFIALIASLLLLLLLTTQGYGQAQIAPIALYMSDDDQTGRIVVRNTGDQPVEVNIEMIYGYPTTDSEGNVYLKKFDEVPEDEPAATSWIRTYPRHTVIPTNEQQTIRFAARPPTELPDGEYWARPAVSVRKMEGSGELTESDGNVQASFNIVQRTILSLNYRQGNVKTDVEIKNFSSQQEGETLRFNAALERTGNAAYLGHIDLRLVDESGNSKKHTSVSYIHLTPSTTPHV